MKNRLNTLQTDFGYLSARFTVTSKDFSTYGHTDWAIIEYFTGADNILHPGEQIILTLCNRYSGKFDENFFKTVIYEGIVDLDGNGWLDSIVISEFGSETILTDKNIFLDFMQYSTIFC